VGLTFWGDFPGSQIHPFFPRGLNPLEELPKMNGQSWASAQKHRKTSRGLMGSQKIVGQNISNHGKFARSQRVVKLKTARYK